MFTGTGGDPQVGTPGWGPPGGDDGDLTAAESCEGLFFPAPGGWSIWEYGPAAARSSHTLGDIGNLDFYMKSPN